MKDKQTNNCQNIYFGITKCDINQSTNFNKTK